MIGIKRLTGKDDLVCAHSTCSIISSYTPPGDDNKEALILDDIASFDGTVVTHGNLSCESGSIAQFG